MLPFFEWCQDTSIATAINNTVWAFPVIEAMHLVGLCVLGGAVLIVDLRMLGVGLRHQRIGELVGYARPWLVRAFALMATTGLLLFLSEAVKCYYSTSFRVKMVALSIALVYTFVVREKIVGEEGLDTSTRTRWVGASSLMLWFTVAAAGRWIGYS